MRSVYAPKGRRTFQRSREIITARCSLGRRSAECAGAGASVAEASEPSTEVLAVSGVEGMRGDKDMAEGEE